MIRSTGEEHRMDSLPDVDWHARLSLTGKDAMFFHTFTEGFFHTEQYLPDSPLLFLYLLYPAIHLQSSHYDAIVLNELISRDRRLRLFRRNIMFPPQGNIRTTSNVRPDRIRSE